MTTINLWKVYDAAGNFQELPKSRIVFTPIQTFLPYYYNLYIYKVSSFLTLWTVPDTHS